MSFLQVSGQLKFELLDAEQTGFNFQNTLVETPQINVLTYQYFHNWSC
jgi:hypothetical protein